MCRLGLGLEAPALAWLWAAQALQNHRPGLGGWPWLGLAWLWPEPRLFGRVVLVIICGFKITP